MAMDPVVRVVVIVVCVAFLAAYFWFRWKRAGQASQAMGEARESARASFEILRQSPAFVRLGQFLDTKYRTTFEPPADAETYRICYLALFDGKGNVLAASAEEAQAKFLIAYLKRDAKPARIQVAIDLASGECSEHELGMMAWSAVVPSF